MSRVKVSIVAALVAVALSAVAAGSASASWFVGGAELKTGSAAIATSAKVDKFAVLNIPATGIKIECTSNVLKGTAPAIVGGTDLGRAQSLIFEECKVITPANCKLKEPKIPTQPVLGLVTTTGTLADKIKFTPETGKLFAEIPFEEETKCTLEGRQPVKGSVTINAPTGKDERELQIIEGQGSLENNSLEVGSGNKAFIEGGSALLRLQSNALWSFH